MKAIKLNKIIWDLDSIKPEERAEVKKSLPTSKGFMAEDDFDVVEKVPSLLAKKFGYNIINFSYSEIPIIDDFEELLKVFAPKGEKPKKLYAPTGELSEYGQLCYDRLVDAIHRRVKLEDEGTEEDEMPKILDKMMLSLEAITGLKWDETPEEEWIDEIKKILQEKMKKYIKSREAIKELRKKSKAEIKVKKDDEEDDEDEDDFEDEDDDDKYED